MYAKFHFACAGALVDRRSAGRSVAEDGGFGVPAVESFRPACSARMMFGERPGPRLGEQGRHSHRDLDFGEAPEKIGMITLSGSRRLISAIIGPIGLSHPPPTISQSSMDIRAVARAVAGVMSTNGAPIRSQRSLRLHRETRPRSPYKDGAGPSGKASEIFRGYNAVGSSRFGKRRNSLVKYRSIRERALQGMG